MYKNILLLGVLSIFLNGCFSKIPQANLYEINIDERIVLEKNKNPKKVAWQGIKVHPKNAGVAIMYKKNKNSVAYFANNQWVSPLPILLESIAQRIAESSGITLAKEQDNLKSLEIDVLDCDYDVPSDSVIVRLRAQYGDSNFIKTQIVSVENGDFSKIIEAMEKAVNLAFKEVFASL